MSIAMLMAMASCSSSDDEVAEIKEESKLVPMTFTATQESNAGTRSALSTGNSVIWQTSDKISVFDGYNDTDHNRSFTLEGDGGEKSGSFTGTASSEATTFTAVYPYTEGATLGEDGSVSGITLPAVQTAYKDSFDPKAALMMAVSTAENKNQLDFKNVVSLVKVTTDFACKSIVLSANKDIAGTGKLKYNDGAPSITFESNQSKTVTLKPATEDGAIAAGTYYIAICPQTLTGFSISFINSTDTKAYTRTSTKNNIFNRREIKNLGTFSERDAWTSIIEKNGNVNASQQIDLGLTITADSKQYRVIFATSNLTAKGLAANESDFGDYFAWGAKEPWLTSYIYDGSGTFDASFTNKTWTNGKSGGYSQANAPFYDSSTDSYTKYTAETTLEASDDAAHVILGGDWQIPTKAIWVDLKAHCKYLCSWNSDRKGYVFNNNYQTLFLPAAGYVRTTKFYNVGQLGYYWSGIAYSNTDAYYLQFTYEFDGTLYPHEYHYRYYGFTVRPVRLVEVSLAGSGETEILDDKGDPFSNNY